MKDRKLLMPVRRTTRKFYLSPSAGRNDLSASSTVALIGSSTPSQNDMRPSAIDSVICPKRDRSSFSNKPATTRPALWLMDVESLAKMFPRNYKSSFSQAESCLKKIMDRSDQPAARARTAKHRELHGERLSYLGFELRTQDSIACAL
jgi:hypothetical protein